mgnify:CR=1 FL=1
MARSPVNPYHSPKHSEDPRAREGEDGQSSEKVWRAVGTGADIGLLAGFLAGCSVGVIYVVRFWPYAARRGRGSIPVLFAIILLFLLSWLGWIAGIILGGVVGFCQRRRRDR